jgi:hypothetical protein CRE_22620
MGRYDDNDSKPKFAWARGCRIEGNLVDDPKELKGGAVAIKVAANYRNYDGSEGVFYVSGIVFGNYGAWAVENLKKGKRVIVIGDFYGHEWEDRDGNVRQDVDIEITNISEDHRWYGADNDDDDDRSSRRSRRSERDSSSRSRRRARDEDEDDLDDDDEEEEEERPTRRRRSAPKRSSDDDDADERPTRRRRSARTVGDE